LIVVKELAINFTNAFVGYDSKGNKVIIKKARENNIKPNMILLAELRKFRTKKYTFTTKYYKILPKI